MTSPARCWIVALLLVVAGRCAAQQPCDVFQESACPLAEINLVGYIVTSDTSACQLRWGLTCSHYITNNDLFYHSAVQPTPSVATGPISWTPTTATTRVPVTATATASTASVDQSHRHLTGIFVHSVIQNIFCQYYHP